LQLLSSPTITPSKGKRREWTAKVDESLILGLFEDKKRRGTESDDDSNECDDEENEDEENWNEIVKSILDRTPVQCLRRYMRHLNQIETTGTDLNGKKHSRDVILKNTGILLFNEKLL